MKLMLIILPAPPVAPKWVEAPTDVRVRAGEDALLPCRASGSPPPLITWRRVREGAAARYQPVQTLGENMK